MDPITILWNTAVFLAAVFSGMIVYRTLKPKYSKKTTLLLWGAAALAGYLISWAAYSIDLYNDLVGILGLSAMVCIATLLLYSESWSAKLFTALMAALIANVVTFLFCGTSDTFLGAAFGLIQTTPYSVGNLLLFIGIKGIVYSLFFALYCLFLRRRVQSIIELLQGKMVSYIAAPAVSIIGFYVINLITNRVGIVPGNVYFFPLYITICVIFVLEYVQIFSSVSWSAKAMKNQAELDVASNIQQNMLPCIFPAFPERDEFDIYASMTPAKEVGGDFYDFFLVDKDHLVMVMADVSGKGVPAALFMVIAKTLLKNCAQSGFSPKEILEKVNNQLCENNEAEMFVTVWIGKLQISSGRLICANAGHEYPVIWHENQEYELVRDKHGFVLAGMENARYREYELTLRPGDKLFLYTDGVTEATNYANELYGTGRMLSALNAANRKTPQETIVAVKGDIDRFVGSAPQFDDITMLSLEIRKMDQKSIERLQVKPAVENLVQVTEFVEGILTTEKISAKIIAQVNVAVDEIFSNIARYSEATMATVECEVRDDKVILQFSDDGIPYDPTQKPDPQTTLPLEDREIGGLGILMVKKSMDQLDYNYEAGRNILTIHKNFSR